VALESADVVLVAYDEIGTKSSAVRGRMEQALASNLEAMLESRGIEGRVERRWSRLFVSADDVAGAARAAADTAGVAYARPALSCAPDLQAIRECLQRAASTHPPGATFAVRGRRVGPADAHPFTSRDIEREGGTAVVEATDAPVDLDDPDRSYHVECRESRAYVAVETYRGPGGLPVGTQGTVVALVSGGIDSPVAAREMLRRGCSVVPVYVDLGAYGGVDHRARAAETVRTLARYAPGESMQLHVVPMGELVEQLVDSVADTRMLSLRRAMLQAASVVADDVGACGVVTGESLGQKSSQTGSNLAVTEAAVDRPVFRPLLTWDKQEIVEAARDLGTFADATVPTGCNKVAPSHPETNATLAGVEDAEPDALLERAAAAARDRTVLDVA
jgi:thiamine biosynthesis protein ThiI